MRTDCFQSVITGQNIIKDRISYCKAFLEVNRNYHNNMTNKLKNKNHTILLCISFQDIGRKINNLL